MDIPDFDEALGTHLQALRREHRCSADELASIARRHGLRWSRSTVSKIEKGDRAVSARELIVLVSVLDHVAWHNNQRLELESYPMPVGAERQVTMLDLMPQAARLTDQYVASGSDLRSALYGDGPPVWRDEEAGEDEPAVIVSEEPSDRTDPGGFSEAEQRAARTLGVDVETLDAVAMDLWHPNSFIQEREARLAALNIDRSEPRSIQAARGQITRKLLSEVRAELQKQAGR